MGMPRAGDGSAEPPPERPRPGQMSALLEELIRGPAIEPGAGWDRALKPGAVIGRFELVREVGRGSFGIVYEARDRELGRTVAFKAIHPGARQGVARDLLLREAEAAALCSHPNIVTLYDLGRSEHGPYLVLEFLRGETLAARLARGPLGVPEALRVGVEIAKGLAHAHSHGVIHRDLTPRNVFLCEDGQVKILDLGMAHAFGRRRVEGGTPGHMAPEQLRGAPEDERTDVYALGLLLHEMLTNEIPARRSGAIEVPALPAMGAIVARALEEDPVRRQRDAGELLAALSGLQRELEHASSGGVSVAVRRRRGFRVGVAAVVAIGLVAVLGAAVALVLHRRSAPTAPSITRVAVLPFANLSGDPSQEYLGDGMAQEIAAAISTVVPVISGSSVERYKRASPGAETIGRELGVAFIVEGSFRRTAGRIRVNASFVRVSDARQMWSQETDLPFEDVLESQRSVATRIVQALGYPLGSEWQRSLGRWSTRNSEAYDEFLQGEFYLHDWVFREPTGRPVLEKARQHYERALALDPTYAPALARLASVESWEFETNDPDPHRLERAESLLDKAMRIDPRLGVALFAHGLLLFEREDYQGAAAKYEQLVRDEPLNPIAWNELCRNLRLVWPRRLAEAERACRRALDINPTFDAAYYHLLRALAGQGKRAEAEQALQELKRRTNERDATEDHPDPEQMVESGRFWIALETGRSQEALVVLENVPDKDKDTDGFLALKAAALAEGGQIDEAFNRLEEALKKGFRDGPMLRYGPWYEPLRKDPRFENLLAKHGLGH